MDSHRLRNRDCGGSPLATHYRSTQGHTIITIHVSSAHARRDVISFLAFSEKSGNMESVGLEPTSYLLLVICNYPLSPTDFMFSEKAKKEITYFFKRYRWRRE